MRAFVPAHFPCLITTLLSSVKSTRTHMYFCMKNSPASEDDFREDLLTVIDHYQVKKNFWPPFERALAHKCSKRHSAIMLLLLNATKLSWLYIQWVTQTLTNYYKEYSSFILFCIYYLNSLLPFNRATTINAMKDQGVNHKGMLWARRCWLRQGP